MADKAPKKPRGKPFAPGQSGNPNGRPPLPAEIKEARKFNKLEVERVFDKFLGLSEAELEKRLTDPETPMLEKIVGKIMIEAAKNGDHVKLDFVLNRTIGKVKDQIQHGLDTGLAELLAGSWSGDNNGGSSG